VWDEVKFKNQTELGVVFGSSVGVVGLNEEQILVFGGIGEEYGSESDECFVVNVRNLYDFGEFDCNERVGFKGKNDGSNGNNDDCKGKDEDGGKETIDYTDKIEGKGGLNKGFKGNDGEIGLEVLRRLNVFRERIESREEWKLVEKGYVGTKQQVIVEGAVVWGVVDRLDKGESGRSLVGFQGGRWRVICRMD